MTLLVDGSGRAGSLELELEFPCLLALESLQVLKDYKL